MVLGCIADDFTGASDLANTLARGGLRTVLLVGIPGGDAPACDAAVIALKTRSIPAPDAVRQSRAALRWLRDRGCRQIVFKYCSTFDSTPAGNIGPVASALAAELSVRGVVVCPAFPETGRTVYQGHLFVGDRLLNESGMEHHPLNPMTDPDLRRWLGRQVEGPVGHVPEAVVAQGPEATRRALSAAADAGTVLVVVDAIRDQDLRTIGAACRNAPLLTGGSGIALGLPGNLIAGGLAQGDVAPFAGARGPGAVLSGSCSTATRAQVAAHAATHPTVQIDVDALVAGHLCPERLVEELLAHRGKEPLLSSTAPPERVTALQRRYGAETVATALDDLFAAVAVGLVAGGVERLVVAGGETAGSVVSALDVAGFEVGPEIDPGVPALRVARPGATLALALKSGNFGRADIFTRAIRMLGGSDD